MLAAEDEFTQGGVKFVSGSFLIPAAGNPADLETRLGAAAKDLGLTVYRLAPLPDIKTHDLDAPRLAVLHTWLNTQEEGWFRLALDKLEIPYSYIPLQEIRDCVDLRAKYDVIIFPPGGMLGRAQRIVNGIGGESPIPWMKTEKYPHLGVPDSREDIRGGIELEGIVHLRKFIEQGGLFIPITSMADLPTSYGLVESVAVSTPQKLKAMGSVLSANITDMLSPIGYGYDRNLGVYFGGGPILETGMKAVTGMEIEEMLGGGSSAGRPSGRGSLKDPDVIQGRASKPTNVQGAGTGIPAEYKDMFDLYMPADLKTVRVVMRFDTADKLLVSGMLDGGEELAGKPAIVDVPLGKGHVVFFAVNPMWRYETLGSFSLLFNAALNYRNLGAGRPEPTPETK